MNPNNPNQYVRAIQSVADIIEDYDSDKYFPVLGFGARQPPDYTQVSHEFFVNGDPSSPFCYKVQGSFIVFHCPFVILVFRCSFEQFNIFCSHKEHKKNIFSYFNFGERDPCVPLKKFWALGGDEVDFCKIYSLIA